MRSLRAELRSLLPRLRNDSAGGADGTLRVHPVILGGGAVHVLVDLFGYFE